MSIYVDPKLGDDLTGDGSEERPFRTLVRADQENEQLAKAEEESAE